MGFINEVVSDEDIDRYALPFPKGAGRWWTRDRERDLYLWGGLSGNPAFDEPILGVFHLFVAGKSFEVVLKPGVGSISFADSPFVVAWEAVVSACEDSGKAIELDLQISSLLKESLLAYQRNGRENNFTNNVRVDFNF